LPVRLLATDLAKNGFPVVRYTVEMLAEAFKTGHKSVKTKHRPRSNSLDKVTHGSDLPIHQLRLSVLTPDEAESARAFKQALWEDVLPTLDPSVDKFKMREDKEVLILREDGRSVWGEDWRWGRLRAVEQVVRGSALE
jgi:hypothetical protein